MGIKHHRTGQREKRSTLPCEGNIEKLHQPTNTRFSDTKTLLALHKARIIDWNPTAALASAASEDGTVLAVARESGNIELWQTSHWCHITTLFGSRNLAITNIAWLQEKTSRLWRLFTCGLDGFLTEWDLLRRRPKHRTDALGGAVWTMAVQPSSGQSNQLAVACDDGSVRLFLLEDGEVGLTYSFGLPSLGVRLLSLAWHPKGNTVVVGTAEGSVHAWDVSLRREILRFHAGDESRERQGVWAVAVLADGTMVSGDSGGNLQFWEPPHGSLVAAFKQHEADILAVAASTVGQLVFASGADHQVAAFAKITAPGKPVQWQYLTSRRPHTHDVRCLSVVSGKDEHGVPFELLTSGGLDAQVFVFNIPGFIKDVPYRLTRSPEAPKIQIATRRSGVPPLLISCQGARCQVCRLAAIHPKDFEGAKANAKEGQRIGRLEQPRQLAEILTEEQGQITASAVSGDGNFLALGHCQGLSLLRLQEKEEGGLQVSRQMVRAAIGMPTVALAFSGQKLLAADATGLVTILDPGTGDKVGEVAPPKSSVYQLPSTASAQLTRAITGFISGSDDKLAVLLRLTEFVILNVEELIAEDAVIVGEGIVPIAAAAISPQSEVLLISLADNVLVWYNLLTRRLESIPGPIQHNLPAKLARMAGTIREISFLPDRKRRAALLSTHTSSCFVDFDARGPAIPSNKRARSKKPPPATPADEAGTNARIFAWKDICLSFQFAGTQDVVMIDKAWTDILSRFPAPLHRHLYGT